MLHGQAGVNFEQGQSTAPDTVGQRIEKGRGFGYAGAMDDGIAAFNPADCILWCG
jgi:hypothetical protein